MYLPETTVNTELTSQSTIIMCCVDPKNYCHYNTTHVHSHTHILRRSDIPSIQKRDPLTRTPRTLNMVSEAVKGPAPGDGDAGVARSLEYPYKVIMLD